MIRMPQWLMIGIGGAGIAVVALGLVTCAILVIVQFMDNPPTSATLFDMPIRLRLVQAENIAWQKPHKVKNATTQLRRLGCDAIGDFEADQFPKLKLRGFVNAKDAFFALIVEMPTSGTTVECVSTDHEGNVFTMVDTKQVSMASPPWSTIEYADEVSIEELYQQFLKRRPHTNPLPTTAGDFVARIEADYARDIDWRLARGGPTADDYRAIAAQKGIELEDATIRVFRDQWRKQAAERVTEFVRDRFFAEHRRRSHENELLTKNKIVIVHDLLDNQSVLDELQSILPSEPDDGLFDVVNQAKSSKLTSNNKGQSDDEFDRPTNGVPNGTEQRRKQNEPRAEIEGRNDTLPARETFRKVNQRLPKRLRFQHLDTVTEPITCDIYTAPNPE